MVFIEKLKRPTALAVAGLMLLSSAVPILVSRSASAYTLLGDREIRLSSSESGATNTTYRVEFEAATAGNVGGIVVTFCENTPIIGDTSCTFPAGFDATGVAVANQSANISTLTTVTTLDQADTVGTNTVVLSNATAVTLAAAEVVSYEITGVTNPTAVGTYYARIMTYEVNTHATGYTLANNEAGGPIVDAGGIALSTAELITIEAKVQERITFCVYTGATTGYNGTDCSAVIDPVVLGDANGVLDSINPSISKDAKYNITTNASTGATIRMKGDTLASGSFTIDAIGNVTPGDGVATASVTNSEQFGFCNYRDTGGGVAGLTPTAPYDHANCVTTIQGQGAGNDASALFAFFLDAGGAGSTAINGTYGSSIASKTAGDWSTGVLVFLGNIDNTTEPGIYTSTLDFIATGRY
ncbi:hypothetical protein BH23PAT2_BH23PAT2_01030 [soil metagenome]